MVNGKLHTKVYVQSSCLANIMSSNESFICENEQFPGTFTKCCNWYTIKRFDDIDILVSNEEYRWYIDISTYRRKFASNWIFLLNW